MIWRADLQKTLMLFVIAFHPLDHPLACTWPIAFYFSKNSEFLSFLWPGNPCKRNSRVSVQAVHRQSAFQRRYSLRELRWESIWQTRACADPVRLCLPEVSHCVLALFSLLFCCWLLVIVLAVNQLSLKLFRLSCVMKLWLFFQYFLLQLQFPIVKSEPV